MTVRQRIATELVSFVEMYVRAEVSDEPITLAPLHVAMIDHLDYCWQHNLTAVIVAPYEHSKSTIARSAMCWVLVHDPRLRLRLVSASKDLAKRSTSLIRDVLMSPRFRQDFPGIEPSRPWTPGEITLVRQTEAADPSLIATGVDSKTTGVRVDLLVCDDMESELASYSEPERQKVLFAYRSKLRHRLSAFGRALVIATRQSPDDVVGQILRDPGMLRTHAVMILSIPTRGPQRASRIDCRTIFPAPHHGLRRRFGWACAEPVPLDDLPDLDAPPIAEAPQPDPDPEDVEEREAAEAHEAQTHARHVQDRTHANGCWLCHAANYHLKFRAPNLRDCVAECDQCQADFAEATA